MTSRLISISEFQQALIPYGISAPLAKKTAEELAKFDGNQNDKLICFDDTFKREAVIEKITEVLPDRMIGEVPFTSHMGTWASYAPLQPHLDKKFKTEIGIALYQRFFNSNEKGKSCPIPSSEKVKEVVEKSINQIEQAQEPHGLWKNSYKAGPFHSAIGSIALNDLGLREIGFFKEEKSLLLGIIETQNPDGGFQSYPTGPESKVATQYVWLALKMALKNQNSEILNDPQAKTKLDEAIKKAEYFIRSTQETEDPPGLAQVFHLIATHCLPQEELPQSYPALYSWFIKLYPKISDFIFNHKNLRESLTPPLLPELQALKILIQSNSSSEEIKLEKAKKELNSIQDENGAWAYTVIATAFNLIALKASSTDGEVEVAESIKKGIRFIRDLREEKNGKIEQIWAASDLWDSAIAGIILLNSGIQGNAPQIAKIIDRMIEEQVSEPDNRWAFVSRAKNFPDNDSSAVIAIFLAKAYATANELQKPKIEQALKRVAKTFVQFQAIDYGWNAWNSKNSWSFSNYIPPLYESVLFDAASTDVSARVMIALKTIEKTGLLNADERERVNIATLNGEKYLLDSQNAIGGWWSRWYVGYLINSMFTVPAIRILDWQSYEHTPTLSFFRNFIEKNQNFDGGWGETHDADQDISFAGKGSSTPLQTAGALIGLIASSPTDDLREDPLFPRITRGVNYLLAHENEGKWKNGKPLFTQVPTLYYYDPPLLTDLAVIMSLQMYFTALEKGVSQSLLHAAGQPN